MKSRILPGTWMGLASALLLSACPFPEPACNVDTDCLAEFRCGPAKTCVPRTSCTSNAACIDELGGEAAICRKSDGKCVALKTADCDEILADADDIRNDNTVWFGSMLPTHGADESTGRPQQNSIEVARRELRRTATGLPPLTTGGPRRPIGYIGCNHDVDPIVVAKHLVENVQVPAIIGAAFSGVTLSVAGEVTIPAGTLLMSPSATSQAITTLDDNGLVWRTSPSDALQAKAVNGLVAQLEPRARTGAGLMAGDPITLVIANKGDGYGQGLGDELFRTLRFNGTEAVNVDPTHFARTDYGDPDDPNNTDPAARYAASVATILEKQPHILIVVGTNEAVTQIFTSVEAMWPSGLSYRPYFIFTDGGQIPELVSAVGGDDTKRRRVFGTVPGVAANDPKYQLFINAYRAIYNDGSDPTVFGTAGAYDAAYLLAYAAAAVGNAPLTGANLREGLKRLVGGAQRVDVGPNNIGTAFMQLGSGGDVKINVDGASGPLDFNTDTGEAPSNIQTWCITNSGGARFYFTGYFYNATTEMMEFAQGTSMLTCP